jgi:heat shock protein HslJ
VHRRILLVAVIAMAVTAAACGSDSRSNESKALIPRDPGNLSGTEWRLVSTDDTTNVPASTVVTIHFEQDVASGIAPCNRYHVPFTVDGTDATVGHVASTLMACAQNVMDIEQRYFNALEKVDTAEIQQARLVLTGPHSIRLVYAREKDAAKLLEGKWEITGIATGNAVSSPVAGTKPTLTFDSDGNLSVTTGCNSGGSTWKVDGDTLTIAGAHQTLMACEQQDISEQETNIMQGLPKITGFEIAPNQAVLLDKDGNIVLTLAREQ